MPNFLTVLQFATTLKAVKNLRNNLFISLVVPVIWVSCLTTDIFLFSDGRPTNLLPRLFEDLVFSSSFFFYGMSGGGVPHSGFLSILKPLAVQFFFWWLVSFVIVAAYKGSRKK